MAVNVSEKAAIILQYAGIRPNEADPREIALAERLAKEYKYIHNASNEFKKIVIGLK